MAKTTRQRTSCLSLPFASRGETGTVMVELGVISDARTSGHELAAVGISDPERVVGFPWLKAEIAFSGAGYLAYFGWLQVVHNHSGETCTSEVDVMPFLSGSDSPLAMFGYLPTFYDAPANPDHGDEEWVADTFLVAIPDIARSKRLTPLTGITWGYSLAGGTPTPLPPRPVEEGRWDDLRGWLHSQYPRWIFETAGGDPSAP